MGTAQEAAMAELDPQGTEDREGDVPDNTLRRYTGLKKQPTRRPAFFFL